MERLLFVVVVIAVAAVIYRLAYRAGRTAGYRAGMAVDHHAAKLEALEALQRNRARAPIGTRTVRP